MQDYGIGQHTKQSGRLNDRSGTRMTVDSGSKDPVRVVARNLPLNISSPYPTAAFGGEDRTVARNLLQT